ncbi:MAG: hypothetical protein RR235_06790 [Oscillospiraceae bacterium]
MPSTREKANKNGLRSGLAIEFSHEERVPHSHWFAEALTASTDIRQRAFTDES